MTTSTMSSNKHHNINSNIKICKFYIPLLSVCYEKDNYINTTECKNTCASAYKLFYDKLPLIRNKYQNDKRNVMHLKDEMRDDDKRWYGDWSVILFFCYFIPVSAYVYYVRFVR